MQINSAKLSIPPIRSRLIARSRLYQKLDQGMDCGFVLVSAPAGYGKSTLINAWLRQPQYTCAWLSLDDRDNDPERFLAYLAAAMGMISPCASEALEHALQTNPRADVETLLTPLINQLARYEHSFFLVLDDYHVIQNQEVHQVVSFLLEHRPPALRLVIATRADPPLSLARLRARSEMLELRQADLCFTAKETSDFLKHTMGLLVSTEDIARITARTEGWIAGLQMAAISLQKTEDISAFITTLKGSHHYIFDYLLEEILNRQSPEIRRFLLNTSILDQLTAPLCDTLLKEDAKSFPNRSSSIILEELEHENLFIIPLDHERRWYRYHSLFADLLRGYLQRDNPDQVPTLHAQASVWFEEQGLIPDAIHHSLVAGEWERVIQLISANVFALLEQNELSTVVRRLDNLTGGKSPAQPWLWIGRAWLAAYMGQLSSVGPILSRIESEIYSFDHSDNKQTLRGHCAAIRAFSSWVAGKRDIAVQSAREALEWLPETDLMIRCQSATVLGLSLDDLDTSSQAFEQAFAFARETSISHVTFFTYGCWAFHLVMRGRLHEAQAACHEAIRLAQSSSPHKPFPTLSHSYATLSLVLWEWNDIEGALFYAREAVSLARQWEQADALHYAYTNLGSALFSAGDTEEAFGILREAWQIAFRTSEWFKKITINQEVEWHLAQGNLEAALQRLRLAQINFEDLTRTDFSSLLFQSFALIFLVQKQYTRAMTAIDPLLKDLEKKKNVYYLVRVLTWQALAYHGLGQKEQALVSLKKALTLAAPEDYTRSFFQTGDALMPLLYQARKAGILPETVERLLASLGQRNKAQSPKATIGSRLVEPLSERELDVVKLLAQGCSDKKIAEALVIARETVHKHLKNIYGKLGVHSRTEAIAITRELGLL